MDIDALVDAMPDEAVAFVADLVEENANLRKRLNDSDDVAGDGDPIAKALTQLPSHVAEVIKADRARLAELETTLQKREEEAADMAYIAKARSFSDVVPSPEEFGPALRRIADALPEEAALVEKALETANARLESAAIFKELGSGLPAPTDAEGRIEAIAKSMVDSGAEADIEAARAAAWERNPDLYAEHLANQRGF